MIREKDIALAFKQVAQGGLDFNQTVLGELKAAQTCHEAGILDVDQGALITMADGTKFCIIVQRY